MTTRSDIDTLWDFDDPAESEQRFRALLPAAKDDVAYELELLTQVARALALQNKFDEAAALLDDIENRLGDDMTRARLRLLIERGRALNASGRRDEARPLFEQAWELGRDTDELDLAFDAGHMIAITEAPEVTRSLEIISAAETSHDPRAEHWLAPLYNNIGWTYHERGAFEQALAQFERALAWREQQGQARETRIARWCVGRTLRSLGRYRGALELQRALHAEVELAGEPDGYIEEELGELLLLTEGLEAARPHFASAYALLAQDQWLAAAEPERLARLKALGAPASNTPSP